MPKMQNPDELLKEINQNLEESIHALDNSGQIDMVSLDSKVRAFCDLIPKLPPVEARACKDNLAVIVRSLNDIVIKMSERKDNIEEEIDTLNQRHRAQNAYGNTNITSNSYNEAD